MISRGGFPEQVGLELGLEAGLDSFVRVEEQKEHLD